MAFATQAHSNYLVLTALFKEYIIQIWEGKNLKGGMVSYCIMKV